MSLQKLENYSNKSVVQEEVLILTELLNIDQKR
ncbi:phosphoenolpyruvate carboxylase [Streptococcus pneumoniae]|nr:phosphoenolpyruvate carboxylase [Streptococcus pneumoniae]